MSAPPIQRITTNRFTIDRMDYGRASVGRSLWRLAIGFVAVFFVSIYRGYEHGDHAVLRIVVALVVSSFIYGLLMLLMFGGVWMRIRRTNQEFFEHPQEFEFSDSSITLRMPFRTTGFDWSAVKYVTQRGRYVVLGLPADQMVVPNSAFRSDAERKAFFDMAVRRGVKRLFQ